MCQFTRIIWTSCGHDKLSTTPEHTLLCHTGAFKLQQGISSAPAGCHPIPDDLINVQMGYVSHKIVQTICLFAFCDDCKSDPDLAADSDLVGTPIISPVEARGDYSDDDKEHLATLRALHFTTTQQCDTALHLFTTALSAHPQNRAAIENLPNTWVRDQLLVPATAPHHPLLHHSLHEVTQLLSVLELYITQRVPAPLFSHLYALARDKFYQTNARRAILCQLTTHLDDYTGDPTAFEAALAHTAAQLASRLGQVAVPDASAFAHLTADAPLHAQHAVAVREQVRRGELARGKGVLRAEKYVPRDSFGAAEPRYGGGVRNRKMLGVDTEAARNAPEGAEGAPEQRGVGDLDIVYGDWEETREVLSPMGVGGGPWGIGGVL